MAQPTLSKDLTYERNPKQQKVRIHGNSDSFLHDSFNPLRIFNGSVVLIVTSSNDKWSALVRLFIFRIFGLLAKLNLGVVGLLRTWSAATVGNVLLEQLCRSLS